MQDCIIQTVPQMNCNCNYQHNLFSAARRRRRELKLCIHNLCPDKATPSDRQVLLLHIADSGKGGGQRRIKYCIDYANTYIALFFQFMPPIFCACNIQLVSVANRDMRSEIGGDRTISKSGHTQRMRKMHDQ